VSEWMRRVGVEVLRSERTEESSTKTRCSELLQGDVFREPLGSRNPRWRLDAPSCSAVTDAPSYSEVTEVFLLRRPENLSLQDDGSSRHVATVVLEQLRASIFH